MSDRVREAAIKVIRARRSVHYYSPGDKSQPYFASQIEEGLDELGAALDDEADVKLTPAQMVHKVASGEWSINRARRALGMKPLLPDVVVQPLYGLEGFAPDLKPGTYQGTVSVKIERGRPVITIKAVS